MGAVSSGRIRRPRGFRRVFHVGGGVSPERNSLCLRTPYPTPFSSVAPMAVASLALGPGRLYPFLNLTPWSPFQSFLLVAIVALAVPYYLPTLPHLRRTGLSPQGRVPLSTSTPLNSYTSTLLRCHPCRHGRFSIRL